MHIHTGVKRHDCDVCGKQFIHAQNLEEHMLIHTDDTPHSCDVCV